MAGSDVQINIVANDSASATINKVQSALKKLESSARQMKTAMSQANTQTKLMGDHLQKVGTQAQRANVQMRDTANSAKKMTTALGQTNSTLTKTGTHLNKVSSDLAKTTTATNKAKSSMGHLSAQITKTNATMDKSASSTNKMATAHEKAQYKIAQTETRMNKLDSAVGKSTSRITQATPKITQYGNQIEKLGYSHARARKNITTTTEALEANNKAMVKVKGQTQYVITGMDKASKATSGFKGKLDAIGKAFSKVGSTISTVQTIVSVVATVGTTIKTAITSVYDASSEYEQLVGGIQTLFQDNASAGTKIIEASKQAYKTSQMSMNEYLTNATSFSAKLSANLDGDLDKVASYVEKSNTAMADNASAYGTSLSTLQETFESLSRGEGRLLDNLKLGYGGTKTELERLLNDYKSATGDLRDASTEDFSMIIDAVDWAQEQLGVKGQAFREATTTLEGSANMLKSAWENMLVSFGDTTGTADSFDVAFQNLEDAFVIWEGNFHEFMGKFNDSLDQIDNPSDEFGVALNEFITDIAETATKILDKGAQILTPIAVDFAMDVLKGVAKGLKQGFSNIDWGSMVSDSISNLIDGLWETIKELFTNPDTGEIEITGEDLLSMFKFTPSGIGSALGELIADGITGSDCAGEVTSALQKAWNTLKSTVQEKFSNIGEIFSDIFSGLSESLGEVGHGLGELFSGIFDGIGETIGGAIDGVVGTITDIFSGIGEAIGGAIEGVTGVISDIVGGLADSFSGIAEAFSNIGQTVSSIASGLAGSFSAIGGAISGAISGVIGAISGAIGSIIGALSGIKSQILSFFASPITATWSVLVTGVGELLSDGLDKVRSTLSKAESVSKTIKVLVHAVGELVSNTVSSVTSMFTGSNTKAQNARSFASGKIITRGKKYGGAWQSGSTGMNGGDGGASDAPSVIEGSTGATASPIADQTALQFLALGKNWGSALGSGVAIGIDAVTNFIAESCKTVMTRSQKSIAMEFDELTDKLGSMIDDFVTETEQKYNELDERKDALSHENDWYEIVKAQREYNEKSALAIGADKGYETEEDKLIAYNNLLEKYINYDRDAMEADMDRIDQAKEDAKDYVDTWENAFEDIKDAYEDVFDDLEQSADLFDIEEVKRNSKKTVERATIMSEKELNQTTANYGTFATEIQKMREKGYPDELISSIISEYGSDVKNGIKIAQKFNSMDEEKTTSWINAYSNMQSTRASVAWTLSGQETTLQDAVNGLMTNISTLATQVAESISPDLASEISSLKDGLTLKIDCEGSNAELGKLLTEIINEYKLTWGVS